MNEILEVIIKSQPHHFVAGMSASTTSAQRFSQAVDQMGRTLSAVGTVAERAIDKVQSAGRRMAVAGTSMGVALAASGRSAVGFDSAMRNVFTIADKSVMSFDKASASVLNLSRTLPQSANDLAAGLYDIESSGIHGADAMEVLSQSAMTASAGLTNTATSAGTITAIMNAYGMSASKAADISDILFQTVNVGVLNFSELAATTGEWVSMAASAGVAVDDAAAALAAMTLSGMNAAESSTSLSRVMTEFLNPGEAMADVLEDLGYASGTMMLEANGLYGSMNLIRQATGGASDQLVKVFGDIRGARGAMALMNNEGENYTRVYQSVTSETERAGAAQNAFEVQTSGAGTQLALLTNNVRALAISLGGPLAAAINMILPPIISVLDTINDLPGPVKAGMGAFLALGSAMTVLVGVLTMMRLRSILWTVAFRAAGHQVTAMASSARMGSAGLTRLGGVLENIGKAGGPLGSFINSLKVTRTAIDLTGRAASSRAPGLMAFAGGFAKASLAIGALSVGLFLVNRTMSDARKEGERAGRSFVKAFDRSSVDGMNRSLGDARDRLREINQDLLQGEQGFDRLSSPGRALDNFRKGLSEVLTGSQSKLNAERKEIQRGMQELAEEVGRTTARMDRAMGVTMTALPGTQLERQLERRRDSFKKFAEDRGLDLTIDIKFEDDPQGYQQQAEDLERQMGDLWREFNRAPSATNEVKAALFDMGKAFDTGKTKIEGLEKVLEAFFAADFGMAAATDEIEGAFNDLYKTVEDMRDRGTLGEALDPTSFHEDAISLRRDLRSITQGLGEQAIEWAKHQDNLSGDEFLNYIDKQKEKLGEYGRSIGLTDEALKPYMDHLNEIANTREIKTKFNSNADQADSKVREYLASLGLADKEINTALRVYKTEGESSLRDYLGQLDVLDNMEVTTVMRLIKEQAVVDLKNWQQALQLTDEQVATLVKLNFEGKPGELEAEMARLGLPQGEVQAFIEIVGKDATDVALAVLQSRLDEIQKEKFIRFRVAPEVGPELQNIENLVNRITGVIGDMDRRTSEYLSKYKEAMKNKDNPATNQGPVYNYPGAPTYNADGSHTAQIASGIRVWAEPETGGEAYIPLAPSKRSRSLAIWQQTGRALGVKNFADGDVDFSSRVYKAPDKSKSDSGGVTDDGWSIVVNMHTVGDITNAEFRQALEDRLASLEKYGDDWTQTWQEIRTVDQQAKSEQADIAEFLQSHFMNRHEAGNVTPSEYRDWLVQMMNSNLQYSDDYMNWWRKLREFDKDAADTAQRSREESARQAEEAVRKEERILEYRNERGQLSNEEYLRILRDKLTREEQYTDRWFDLQDLIQQKEEDVLDRQRDYNDKIRTRRDTMFEAGKMSRGVYIAELYKDLAAAEEYSEEWLRITQRIGELSGESAIRSMGNVTNTPFSNSFISGRAVANYFTKQAQRAVTWGQTLNQLAGKGVNKTILDQLVQAGPDSLPMAQALVRVYNDPSLRAQFEAAQSTISGVAGAFNPAPIQPKTTNFQSSSWFQPGSQGSVTVNGPLVNIESYAASSASDVEQLSNSISFQIRSAL